MQCVRFNFIVFILIITNAFAFAEYCISKMSPWLSLVYCSWLFLFKVLFFYCHFRRKILLLIKQYIYSIIFICYWSFVPLYVCMAPGLFIIVFFGWCPWVVLGEKENFFTLGWLPCELDIAKQYRLCCPGLAVWQERRVGNEIRLCKVFCSIELLVDWYKTFIWGGIMSM